MTEQALDGEIITPEQIELKKLEIEEKERMAKIKLKKAAENSKRMQLIKVGEQGLEPTSLDGMVAVASRFAGARALPKTYLSGLEGLDKEEQSAVIVNRLVMAMQLGAEVGLPTMHSIKSVAFVNDMPSIWGDAQLAIVRKSGLLEDLIETFDEETETAYCTATRKDGGSTTASFSKAEANTAGLLGKDSYKKYLTRMLKLRARAFCLRDLFTDVLGGLTHTVEEMSGFTDDREFASDPVEVHKRDKDVFAANLMPAIENKPAVEAELIEENEEVEVENGN